MDWSPAKKKGLDILAKINDIEKVGKDHYLVNSQTTAGKKYHVKAMPANIWSCTCHDFHYRLVNSDDKQCKHIHACIMLRDAIEREFGTK